MSEVTQQKRGQWNSSIEFLLTCIAISSGLNSCFLFAYEFQEDGGIVYLFHYVLATLIFTLPIYYLEMIMGQYSSRSNVKVYDCVPAMRGFGIAQIIYTFLILTYQIRVGSSYFVSYKIVSSLFTKANDYPEASPTDKFLFTVQLVIPCVFIFLTLIKGVKSIGKVSSFITIATYAIFTILLICVLTLDGAFDGIKNALRLDFEKLFTKDVRQKAYGMSLYRLNIFYGCLVTYASYSKTDFNIRRISKIVTIVDILTVLLLGIFSSAVVGHLCFQQSKNKEECLQDTSSGNEFLAQLTN